MYDPRNFGNDLPATLELDMPTQPGRKAAARTRLQRDSTHDEIYERIYVAILEHRLHPGTKLAEERLAEIFDVSRARIREVLARLAHEQIVELVPQRGAYVAKPTIEQARDVFEARRLIEPAVLRRLIATLTPEKLARLSQHNDLEVDARQREDNRAVVRLSGEFHSLAAELAGNSALARSMRELSVLTCLMIVLYDAPTATSCRADEHSQIIDAIAKRDAARAERLMLEHLDHIQSSMKLEGASDEVDLEEIFRR
ncbi:transcriptional regulator, GntR family [Paraburkholderia susongensis]|uniref:Transcriptional regulator, GntR family n=2 Tax=Paraburkholderia susongensis TaxID=1515439 RepID=A0A1X7IRR5_9BURK|nr:transcriptional regulator, GntR family [Paraburkholderia susongensis]